MIKNLFFDFDGVILDSVSVKSQAFYELYLCYGSDIANKVVEHHENNGGMSRFEKFPYYHKYFLNKTLNLLEINTLSEKFSELTFKKVINSKKISGIDYFLNKFHKKYKMWVITGTPTVEIRKILDAINYDKFFISSYGSPEKKEYWVNKIINKNNLEINECLFIGDAKADYSAATKTNIKFALKENKYNIKLFKNIDNISRFNNYNEFKELIL